MRLPRRPWVALVLVLCTLPGGRANAWVIPVIPVEDAARFLQMVENLRQLGQLYDQLTAGWNALRNAATRLGGGVLVEDTLLGLRYLAADLDAIGYHLDTVSTQFRRVFPDEEAVRNTPAPDVDEVTRGWDSEIHQSSLAAVRAQTALSRIETNTRSASAILERSHASTEPGQGSQLAQLQALVQMLGVVNSDVATLASMLAATERVNASLGGAEASEWEVETERRRRLLEGYAEPRRVSPGIDRRFLR